jgi:tetratricopeptide (TPR) repeat protein
VAEHLSLARQAQQAGDTLRAESEYREALGRSLTQLGAIYNALDQMKRSEEAYQQAIEAYADSDDALIGLGIVYLRTARADKGIATARRLLEQKPYDPRARQLLGELYLGSRDYKRATFELDEAHRLAPGNFDIAYMLASAYLQNKQLDLARKTFTGLQQQVGDSPQLHMLFGRLYREADFISEATDEFERAAALDPHLPHVHFYLGMAHLVRWGTTKLAEARAQFQLELDRDPNDYFSNYFAGIVCLYERDLPNAVKYLEKASQLNPEGAEAYNFLGQALTLSEQYDRAETVLKKAIALTSDPSVSNYRISSAHYMLGQVYRHLGKTADAQKQFAQAEELKSKLSQSDQERMQAYLAGEPGKQAPDLGELAKPSEGATIFLEQNPPNDRERAEMEKLEKFYAEVAGNAYDQLGRMAVAREDFARAADFWDHASLWSPDSAELKFNMGLAYFKAQKFKNAIPPLERVCTQEPARIPAQVLLGLSYYFADDYPRARQRLEALTGGARQDPQVMYALALSMAHTGDAIQAERILRGMIAQHPGAADLHQGLGQVHALGGMYADAAGEFSKALELDPKLPDGHYSMGLALFMQSKFQAAADQLRQEIDRNPRHAKAQYHLGLAYLSMDQLEEGLARFAEAIRLDPSYAEAYYEIGKVQLRQGKVEEALKNLAKAAELSPDKSYIQYQLSQAYLKLGRSEEAQAALVRYRDLKAQERKRAPEAPHSSLEAPQP